MERPTVEGIGTVVPTTPTGRFSANNVTRKPFARAGIRFPVSSHWFVPTSSLFLGKRAKNLLQAFHYHDYNYIEYHQEQ